MSSVAIIIPALNEEASIGHVVEMARKYGQPIVVNDGSTDQTEVLAQKAGAIIVSHPLNQGYDAALASGLSFAVANHFNFAVTMDADGQHNPELLGVMIETINQGADIVVGVRDIHQRISEIIFAFIGRFLWNIEDPLCGMKAYRISKLRLIGVLSTYHSIGTEIVIRGARSRWRIAQLPIITTGRVGASRFGAGFKANWKILRALALGIAIAGPVTIPCQASKK